MCSETTAAIYIGPTVSRERDAENRAALNRFLQSVERASFKMAQLATKHREDALDIVQDTMLVFVKSYADKPGDDWRPLYFSVLDSRIYDFYRRQHVRRRVWWSSSPKSEDDDFDPIAAASDLQLDTPLEQALSADTAAVLERCLQALPLRQRQAFLFRVWHDYDVAQTAKIMRCSEGSVKTHLFRAMSKVRTALSWHDNQTETSATPAEQGQPR